MKKNTISQFGTDYTAVLGQMKRDLEAMIYQLESQTLHKASGTVPIDIEFDSVPILRKLKETHTLVTGSFHHFSR